MKIEINAVEYPIKLLCEECGKSLTGTYSVEKNAIIVVGCNACMFTYIARDPKKTGI